LALESNLDGYIGLGDAHINSDDHFTAIEYFTKASKEVDCQGIAYTRLAFTYVLMENATEALRFFNLAFERDPTEEKLADLVYGCLINEDIKRASQLLEKLKSNFGESYLSIIFDLIIMAKKGKVSEAQKMVDHLFDHYSDEEIELVKLQLKEWGVYINPEPE
jgi:tetratricopeptide (TPR) repeat protein